MIKKHLDLQCAYIYGNNKAVELAMTETGLPVT